MEAHTKVWKYSLLPTKVCGIDGCNKLVHHLFQINWEIENQVELGGGKLQCREHHPDCNVLLGDADGKQKGAPILPPPQLPLPSNTPRTTASPYQAVLNFLVDQQNTLLHSSYMVHSYLCCREGSQSWVWSQVGSTRCC
jgi:hypothetical protein